MMKLIFQRIIMVLTILIFFTSCITTEVLGESHLMETDSLVTKKYYRPLPPPIDVDTTRVPITFNPSVEDWEEQDINIKQM